MKAIQQFWNNPYGRALIAGLAAGLYPIFFYYSNNLPLVNSWSHIGYFVLVFLACPMIAFVVAQRVAALPVFNKVQKYALPFLNLFVFLFLMKVCLYAGIQKKITLGIIIVAALVAFFLWKHFKKVVILQLILALIGLVTFVPALWKWINYSDEWLEQPDGIEQVVFTKKPNVYFIQPDGYVNIDQLSKPPYNVDNSEFDAFRSQMGFKDYGGIRSNYPSTLTSNSSIFTMKHHYYNRMSNFSEAINARDIIVSDNPVLNAFKNNGYKTHFLSESPYLMLNKPKMGYDACNYDYSEVNYISTGLVIRKNIMDSLTTYIDAPTDQPKFYFIEIMKPGHIHGRQAQSLGIEGERDLWVEAMEKCNEVLTEAISTIKEKDPNALIIMLADHGGFVGMEYTGQIYNKTQDKDLIYSVFSTMLSIHWPDGQAPAFDDRIQTPVNLFRVLFSYLSDDLSYLEHLQEDKSFVILNNGAPKGVYAYIDDDGSIIFKKH